MLVGYNATCIYWSQNKTLTLSGQLSFSNTCHWTRGRKNVGKLINTRPSATQGKNFQVQKGAVLGSQICTQRTSIWTKSLTIGYLGYEVKASLVITTRGFMPVWTIMMCRKCGRGVSTDWFSSAFHHWFPVLPQASHLTSLALQGVVGINEIMFTKCFVICGQSIMWAESWFGYMDANHRDK